MNFLEWINLVKDQFYKIDSYKVYPNDSDESYFPQSTPIIKYTTSILSHFLNLDDIKKNLIINFPKKNGLMHWIILDTILNHMRSSFKEEKEINYIPGDLLEQKGTYTERITRDGTTKKIKKKFVGKFIEEYQREDEANNLWMKLEYKDGLKRSLPKISKRRFRLLREGKITSMPSHKYSFTDIALDHIIDRPSTANFLLFNTSFILIDRIKEMEDFVANYTVVEDIQYPIKDLIKWSKSNESGGIEPLTYRKKTMAPPNCVVAADLDRALQTIEKNPQFQFNGVFISDIGFCEGYESEIASIIEKDIPVIILANNLDKDSFDLFCKDSDFYLWNWNRETIKELLKK